MRKGYKAVRSAIHLVHKSCRSTVSWWDNTILALLPSNQPFEYHVAFVKPVHFGWFPLFKWCGRR